MIVGTMIVGAMIVGAIFVGAMIVGAMIVRAMIVGVMTQEESNQLHVKKLKLHYSEVLIEFVLQKSEHCIPYAQGSSILK